MFLLISIGGGINSYDDIFCGLSSLIGLRIGVYIYCTTGGAGGGTYGFIDCICIFSLFNYFVRRFCCFFYSDFKTLLDYLLILLTYAYGGY